MYAWIGLVGVVAGALIAIGGQFLNHRSQVRVQNADRLLEQLALIVALSEDFRNRVWEERNDVADQVVRAWDLGAYRLAEARLRILCPDPALLSALKVVHDAGSELGRAWRLAPQDTGRVRQSWEAHRSAIDTFAAAAADQVRGKRIQRGPARLGAWPTSGRGDDSSTSSLQTSPTNSL
jgi:hypothetical protein